jgi:hypothetical protein
VTVKEKVVLPEGTNEIRVDAGNLGDKGTTKTVKVEVDLTGPTIGIFAPIDPTVTESAQQKIEGVSVDKNGVVSVALGDRVVAESKGDKRLQFASGLPLGDGENSFIVMAKDIAGNETRSSVKVFKGKPTSAAARLWLLQQRAPQLLQMASTQGLSAMAAILFGADAPPQEGLRINLKSPEPDKPYRHNKTLCISGDAISNVKIASLTINGQPFTDLTGAPKESFSRRIPIDVKENDKGDVKVPISIQAKDEQGREITKAFEVPVRPVQMDSKESRMPLAVLAFAGNGVEPALADMLRVTSEAKINDMNRFRIVDRTRLQDVLNEQQLAAALANPNDAISLGKLTNAYVFIVADVFPRDQKGLEIKARAISSETSDLIATLDSFIEDKNDKAKVDAACNALAAQIVKTFPRLSGEVLAVKEKPDGDELLVNWTKEDGIREGMYLLVVKEGEPWVDKTTGEVLEKGEIEEIARAKIQSILASGSKAKTIKREKENVKLEQGMAAVAM